jgi:cation-transporting P-type ATPase F
MTTSVFLGLALAFEPKERDLMQRPPRSPVRPILDHALLMRTGLVSLLMLAGAFGLFLWESRTEGSSLAEARTVVVNVIVEAFYLLNCRSLTHSVQSLGLFSNPWAIGGIVAMIAAQLFFTYAPVMNRLFHSAPISGEAWLRIVGVGLVVFLVVGLEKWLRFGSHTGHHFVRNRAASSP